MRLDDTRAVVIGASSGIGRAIAEAYDSTGARVAIAARSVDTLEDIAESADTEMIALECDVTDPESVDSAIESAVDAFGGLDVVVNSAGVILRSDMVDTSEAEMEWVVDVNLKGMMRVAKAAIPHLAETNGTFIPVSSQLGEVGVEGVSVYCGTKGGINNLTRQLAIQYAEEGVRINALAPGIVGTDMNEEVRSENDEWEEKKAEQIPLGRIGTPKEIAGPAVFLASNESRYMTGHVLVVDGGYLAQ